jgi:outer membrane receptor protein involved in Fe transport
MRKLPFLILAIASLVVAAFGQSQSTSGNIEGRVIDSNGAVVPGVSVSATNKDTGFGKTVLSDGNGNYLFVLLPPGNYKVETAAAKGFAASTYDNVRVTVGAKNSLDITLTVGSSVNVVDVTENGQVVETTRTSISSTVDERRVINLPTNGRNFLDFATLTPGIIRDPTRAGDLAVGGQKGTLNSIQIDGASSDNTFFGQSTGRTGSGRAPSEFSVDTVKEFQVNQNGFSAEYGRAAGAVVNVITKSGTNRLSGSVYEYFRDESLNALNPNLRALNRPKPPGQINQFGGTIGGPIRKDKIFFFGSYEGQRSKLPNPVVLPSLATAPANVQSFLGPKTAAYDVSRQQDVYLAKFDFNINDRNQVWVRFNQQNFTGTNLENSGTLSASEHTGNSNVTTTSLTASWTHTFTPKWFNEFRFQFSRDREPGNSNTTAPEATITTPDGTFNIGRNNFSPRETTINRYQFINNQTYIAGNHAIKYGADLLFDRILNFFPGLFSGSYRFTSYATLSTALSAPLSTTPAQFRQSFGGAGTTGGTTHPNNNEFGFFIQDDWKVAPKWTLNLGLRYDYQLIAKPPIQNPDTTLLTKGFDTGFRPSDKNNIAPRFGFSYAFDEKTVLRGGYGLYYGRTPAIMTGTAHSQNGVQVLAVDILCGSVPVGGVQCPVYPNVFTSFPTGARLAPVNLYLFSKDYKQPFTQQARVQFEREIFKNTTFSIQYTMFRGSDLSRTRNANLQAPVPTAITVYSGSPATPTSFTFLRSPGAVNPAYGRISLFESTARSLYNGLTFELNRRFSHHLQFNVSYTLSKAKDDKPDQTSVVPGADDGKIAENQYDLTGEYGRSDLDVRQRFIFSPVYETGTFKYSDNKFVRFLLSDYVLTGIFTAQSGFAYSALVSGDPNGDGNTATDRVPGTLRNQFSTPPTYVVDMRFGRTFKFAERYRFSIFAEGFNLFNRSNIAAFNNTQYAVSAGSSPRNYQTPRLFVSGSPSFSLTNSSYNREFQLGARFDF